MTIIFSCPYLRVEVELTEEREKHIADNHPDLLPKIRDSIAQTLSDPDQIRRSKRFESARLFSKWFEDVKDGKYIVVVVMTDSAHHSRHWIITAYIARRLSQGEIEWKKN
mgnify:CR=1 FL=1|jgi:hypothetical protein